MEREEMMMEMILLLHTRIQVLGYVSRHFEASISGLSGTTDETTPHPPAREINVKGTALHSLKNGYVICVTEPISRRIIMCIKDLCDEGYDPDKLIPI